MEEDQKAAKIFDNFFIILKNIIIFKSISQKLYKLILIQNSKSKINIFLFLTIFI